MIPSKLRSITTRIKDKPFRAKVESFIERSLRSFESLGGLDFYTSPAGKSHHHSYAGGLLQHTLSMVKIALALCKVLRENYGCKHINSDYVLAGVLLHDLYKPLTYMSRDDGMFEISNFGEQLDHLSLLIGEAYKEGFPAGFIHILASSHGDASPIRPRSLEALTVHLADLVDSRLIGEIQTAAFFYC